MANVGPGLAVAVEEAAVLDDSAMARAALGVSTTEINPALRAQRFR